MSNEQAQPARKQLIDALRVLSAYDEGYASMLMHEVDAYNATYDEQLPA